MKIGILGFGAIGHALARGLRVHPHVQQILATTRTPRAPKDVQDVVALNGNRELVAASDVIILCVKPAQMKAVVREIAEELRPGMLLVSVAAAVDTASIHAWITEVTGKTAVCPIVRAMPNMPCRIGTGMTAIVAGPGAAEADLATVRGLFEMLGRVVIAEEWWMDAVTAISGCGPAYVYVMIEALAEGGVKLGLPRGVALELAAQTLHGASAMVLATGAHPAALKDEVTTPAGCTIAGLLALEDGGIRSILIRGVAAAATRSAQLAV